MKPILVQCGSCGRMVDVRHGGAVHWTGVIGDKWLCDDCNHTKKASINGRISKPMETIGFVQRKAEK